jgi:hypothetical protein
MLFPLLSPRYFRHIFPEAHVIGGLMALLMSLDRRPLGFAVLGAFLFFGAVMAGLAGTTLLWRGTVFDRAWMLNPTAYRQLSPLGSKIGILFLLLSSALLASGIGWFRHRLWGWRLAVAIIAIQVLGDIINLVKRDFLRRGIGVVIASAVLIYLLTPRVRAEFSITRQEI